MDQRTGGRAFHAVQDALGHISVIAKDFGIITSEIDALREELRFPGMRILQMSFGYDAKASEYRPHHQKLCRVHRYA